MKEERKGRAGWALALVALFFLVYGAKSTLIGAAGSPLPYSDQWNFEALGLYRPYLSGTLDWSQLLAPYNEHRMFFTRLLLLGLFELRGGWDPILDMLVNGLIGAAAGVVYAAIVVPVAPERWRPLVFGFIAFCLVLPLGFENTLMGMNSHFYLFILLSLLAVTAMGCAAALSGRWLFGFVCVLLIEFTLASGALTPIAAAAAAILQAAIGVRARSAREVSGIVLQLAAGVLMRLSTVPHDVPAVSLQAQNLGDFLWAAVSVASLPLFPIVGLVVVHAPLAWLLVRTVRTKLSPESGEWALLAIAVWIAGQLLAIAFSRYQTPLSSRYLDIVVLLLPLDLVALALALTRRPEKRPGRWLAAYAGMWLFIVVAATGGAAYFSSWRLAYNGKAQLDASQPHITAYLQSGDTAEIEKARQATIWLFPSTMGLAQILSDPHIKAALPAEIKPPNVPSATASTVLKGSFSQLAIDLRTALSAGPLWAAIGGTLLFLAAFRRLLRDEPGAAPGSASSP